MRVVFLLAALVVWSRTAAAESRLPGSEDARPGQILVQFQAQVPNEALAGEARRLAAAVKEPAALRQVLLEQEGLTVDGNLPGLRVKRVTLPAGRTAEDAIRSLSASPLVHYCQPNYLRRALATSPNDTFYQSGNQWWLQMIQADRVVTEDKVPSGNAVIVAVLDTGVMLNHADLAARLTTGIDLTGTAGVIENGHGTHVAGIVAAATNNNLGIAGTAGIAPIQVMPVKVLAGPNGEGDDYTIAQGILWAVDHGARVLNMSFGGTAVGRVLMDAISYAHDHGCVVAAAAGNDAVDESGFLDNPVIYPAAFPSVIAVAASTTTGARTIYSEFGQYIDVAAPGGYPGVNALAILSTWPDSGIGVYKYEAGTSMATPMVAGAAALLLVQNPAFTPEEVENRITTTAEKTGLAPYVNGWNPELGWGNLNVYRALTREATYAPKSPGRASYNYPNPFQPGRGDRTFIVMPLAAGQTPTSARLRIFDAVGRLVRTLEVPAGQVTPGGVLVWDGRNDKGHQVANGTYPYRLELNGSMYLNKIVVKN